MQLIGLSVLRHIMLLIILKAVEDVWCDEIIARDKTSLDITWLKDKSLADLDNLPDPDVLAEVIAENLESALGSFQTIIKQLKK